MKLREVGKIILSLGVILGLVYLLIEVDNLTKEMDIIINNMLALATKTDAIIENSNTKIYDEDFNNLNDKLNTIIEFINTQEDEEEMKNEDVVEVEKEIVKDIEPTPIIAPSEPTPTDTSDSDISDNTGSIFQLTAYTWTGNPMANGQYPYVGACASNYFPLGTVLYIEGYGTYTVCDRGGMANNVIDIYMETYEECIQFGRRSALVTVIN